MNYTRQTDFTDLRETLNKLDTLKESKFNDGFPETSKEILELIKYAEEQGDTAELEELYHALEQRLNAEELTEAVLTEKGVSITTLNRWSKYAKDVADYMSNQLSAGDTVPTTMDSFLKNSGFSDDKKQEIKDDPYYFSNIKKVALAVNNNDLNSLGNTGPKSEMGTSFGGGSDTTVTGRERQIKLDPALKSLQGLATEKENSKDTEAFYYPQAPDDIAPYLHGAQADDGVPMKGALDADVAEPTWAGQTADEIRAELDSIGWPDPSSGEGQIMSHDDAIKGTEKPTVDTVATDPAGQTITDPEDDTPLDTMDWDMDDIDQQFKDLDAEYATDEKAKVDAKAKADLRKEVQQDIDMEKEIEQDGSRDQWATNFSAMSDEEFKNVNYQTLIKKYGDNALDGYLDSKFDRKDNAYVNAVDAEIKDLNKSMDTDTTVSTAEPKVTTTEPKADVNYGAMSDKDYDAEYDKEMEKIVAKGYNPTADDFDEKVFDDDMWKQLGQLDAKRAEQKKDIQVDKRMDWDMRRAVDQFAKLDKEVLDREAKAKEQKEKAYMDRQMRDADKQFDNLDKEYAKDNPEGFDKVSSQAGKAWDEIKKTGAELADYTGADDAVDTISKGASDAYDYATKGELEKDVNKISDYVTKGDINKDASRFKKYMQSGEMSKDAKAKGKEHKAYVDKKAGEVSDYFTGGEFGKDVDDASDWIGNQWNSMFGDKKK